MKIGIDIGGSHIATGIVNEEGKIICKQTFDISKEKIKSEEDAKKLIINTIDQEIKGVLKETKYDAEDISKIGLAVPGNPTETAIKNVVNLHIKEFQIGKILEEKYKAKVLLKNDGKCAGLAEKKFGALKPYGDCIFLCIGTGVGCAVFLDGDLLEPRTNSGFEIGHMIINKNGPKCNCGKKGCFETYASMKRLKKSAIKTFNLKESIESIQVQKFIRENINKKDVKQFVDNYIDNLSIGISNIINIFEPEAICFGGSFSYYGDIFIKLLEENLKKYTFNKESKYKLLTAKLKNDAGIVGAANL